MDFASGERLSFHFQIHFDVNIRGVERHVTEPGADSIDVDTRAKKVRCRRVSNGMWAHALLR